MLKAVHDTENEMEDLDYFKQELLSSGVLPSQIDEENIFEILKVQKARKREDRPMSADEAFAKLQRM